MQPRSDLKARRLAVCVLGLVAACSVSAFVTQEPLSFWPVGNVEWKINLIPDGGNIPNPPLQDGSATWDDAFMVAIDAYNAVIPDNVLTLSAVKQSGVAAAQSDQVNNVAFSDTVYGNSWGSNTLGISISSWSGNKRVENDILFNSTKKWNAYTGNQQSGTNDFRRVAIHELGHSLGLDHPDEAGQIVSAIMNSTTSNLDALTQDDIDGVLSIYGATMPLVITTHPQSQTVPSGGEARFEVVVTGSEPISYDWQRSTNGGTTFNSLGLDARSIIFPSVSQFSNGHQFRVIASNSATGDSVTSEVAVLTVTATAEAPVFTAQPADASINEGQDAQFTVTVSGSPTPTLQWQVSTDGGSSFQDMTEGIDGTGTTSATLTVSGAPASADGNQYRCVATNSAGTATSSAATLSVSSTSVAPAFTVQPSNASITEGEDAQFTVAVSGSPAPSLQWQVSTDAGSSFQDMTEGVDGTGTTTATLTVGSATVSADGNRYRCVATNSAGTATSDIATLTVASAAVAPGFTSQPESVSVLEGEDATFTVAVSGSPAPTLQWQISTNGGASFVNMIEGLAGTGTTTTTLTVGDVAAPSDGYQFRCVATNSAGSATGNAATLTVRVLPPAPATTTAASTSASAATVSWDASGGATGYRVDLARDAAFTDFALPVGKQDEDVGNVTSLDLTGLTSGTWYFRVRAYNANGTGADSAIMLIEVNDGRMINLSTRGQTTTGASVMIAGFVVGGTQPKQLLIRAVGPTLSELFGLSGTVEDTRLVLQRVENGVTLYNETFDNWDSADAALVNATDAVGAFQLAGGSLDAAALVTLDPGAYTAQVETATGTAGVAIVEVYETDQTGRLVNISTRGFVGVGDAIIIPGTVISGNWKRVLVRAVGETIGQAPFNVPGVLEDPVLDVFPSAPAGAPPLFTNDDWGAAPGDIATVTDAVGAFQLLPGSRDAALLIDVENGGYTFQVSGKNGATGVVIVELYEVP